MSTAFVSEKFPVHLWLHEASLAGCYLYSAAKSSSVDWAREFVAAKSGQEMYSLEPEDFHARGITFLGPVLARARSAIVSSRQAADVVRRECADGPPILVLPLAFPVVPAVYVPPARRVVSVGWLAPNKRPAVLVHLAARLGVDVSFVGPVLDPVADEMRALAVRLGVAERIEITGRLPQNDFDRVVASARVGVQLRTGSIGQRSAAVNDLVARGIPVVTDVLDEGAGAIVPVDIVGLDDASAADVVAAAIGDLLDDDVQWFAASQIGRAHV